jgi:putative SOS response-associated peptidase YedK
MAPIHDRMPVIIDREMVEVWLHAAPGEARDLLDHLLQPASVGTLTEYEVGVEVNDARNESPDLITAVTDHPPTTLF